ncbi:hypothetical protein G9272_19230 [Streptomyces asoensis]|uniref:Sel1 repeat family protein n=1 Tax=Streptomyces asoensis TaxID=249586 RepID=A0A6M4WPQ3_9ACTN|nr:hypothetical protein [Streptomyces asoensis]QJT02189.1 hypothetical protein G9272_19230 [Streptomyces asoensis]
MDHLDIYCGACGYDLYLPVMKPADAENAASRGWAADVLAPDVKGGSDTVRAGHTTQDHIDFRQNSFHGPVIGVQNNYGSGPGGPPADSWPRLAELRGLAHGVRSSRRFGDGPVLPPYVPRDCDGELDELLADALISGGLVVVTGEPLSGKTMTAWVALNRGTGDDTRVYTAPPGTDLRELPSALRDRDPTGTHVVWLDDLESHVGEQGLTAGILARLTHEGVLVLATMRDEAYDTHRFRDHPTARVLSGARTVELTCRWSETELGTLAWAEDPRLVDAMSLRDTLGVTQYLALGPELWEEWRRAGRPSGRPSGHLLVRVAVDAARCGITRALPLEVWESVITDFAPYADLPTTSGTFSADDLEWAARPRLGVSGLLVSGEEGTWRASGTLVVDALRSPDLPPPDPHLWWVMAQVARAHSPDESMGVVAVGSMAVRAVGDADDEQTLRILGEFAVWAGHDAEVRHWYGKLANRNRRSAHFLANYLAEQGEYAEAIRYLEMAAEAGHVGAQLDLGLLLVGRAEHWLTVAVQGGDSEAVAARVLAALRQARAARPDTVRE